MMEPELRTVVSLALLLLAVLQVPLLLGRVPPNRLYGFRTPKTQRPEVWYPANAFAARAFLATSVLALILLWTLPHERFPEWYPVGVLLGAVALALVASLFHLRRYP